MLRAITGSLLGVLLFATGTACVPTDCSALAVLCRSRCRDPYVAEECLELARKADPQTCHAAYRRYARACPDEESLFD